MTADRQWYVVYDAAGLPHSLTCDPDVIPSSGPRFHITGQRVDALLSGEIPLSHALDAWPPVPFHDYPHVWPLGYQLNQNFWHQMLGMIDGNILSRYTVAIWDWHPNAQKLHQHFPWHRITEIFNDRRPRFLIIDGKLECMNPDMHMQPLLQQLHQDGWTRDQLCHVSANQCHTLMCKTVITRYGMNSEWFDVNQPCDWASSHFVMLIRKPWRFRVLAVVEVLRRDMQSQGAISCGTISDNTRWIQACVPEDLRHHFPMQVDSTIVDQDLQYQCQHPSISGAAINVICETSQDLQFNAGTWSDVFITEKTSKAFWLCQLPIWIAVPHTVADVRSLGFDVFDDIIDHSYDTMADPNARVAAAVDQLQKLCQMDIDAINRLRRHIWSRLMANRDRLISLSDQLRTDMARQLVEHLHANL